MSQIPAKLLNRVARFRTGNPVLFFGDDGSIDINRQEFRRWRVRHFLPVPNVTLRVIPKFAPMTTTSYGQFETAKSISSFDRRDISPARLEGDQEYTVVHAANPWQGVVRLAFDPELIDVSAQGSAHVSYLLPQLANCSHPDDSFHIPRDRGMWSTVQGPSEFVPADSGVGKRGFGREERGFGGKEVFLKKAEIEIRR